MEMSKKRGFANMSPEQRRKISSMGGKAAHQQGTAHRFSREEARECGSKGGLKTQANIRRQREAEQSAQVTLVPPSVNPQASL